MAVEISYGTTEPIPDPITGAVDGVYAQNNEHAAEAVSHLISFFRYGPRNQAVLASTMAQVQELEDNLWLHQNGFDVDTAVGHQLDLLGKRVGERRENRTDAVYRTAVRVRILVNLSNGKLHELLAIIKLITEAPIILARELYPAALEITPSTYGSSSVAAAYQLMKKAKPAGVRLLLTSGVGMAANDNLPAGPAVMGAADGSPLGFIMGGGA